jgi:superfamily II DNA helicase RecQ
LNYFGETLAEPCGNCDTCLEPVESWDGTIATQKALSAVRRTGQRFGQGYLIDLLLGQTAGDQATVGVRVSRRASRLGRMILRP